MAVPLRDSLIPSVFYPTTVVMMDDDPGFLSSAATYMDDFPTARFTTYHEALDFVRRFGDRRALDSSDVTAWLANPERFRTVSVVLVDYQMDSRNGIEFCHETASLPVRRIMVSGQMSDPAAIELLNGDIVERYVSKRDPDRWDTIGAYTRQMQDRYMLMAHPHREREAAFRAPGLQGDALFKEWLLTFCANQNFVEFIRVPVGFLLVDTTGAVSMLLVRDEDEVRTFAGRAEHDLQAPTAIVERLAAGRTLVHNPDDPWGDRLLAVAASANYWNGLLHEGHLINGRHGSYLVALTDDVRPYPDEAGYCYDDYLDDLRRQFGSSWEL